MSDEYGYEASPLGGYKRKAEPEADGGSDGPSKCSYPKCTKRGQCKVSDPSGFRAIYCFRHTVAYVKSVVYNIARLNHSVYIQRAPGVKAKKPKSSGKVFQ